jgi:hypothetical protein
VSCDWPKFSEIFWVRFFFLFPLFYQVFELKKEEAGNEIAKLEADVFFLQERLEEDARFDISLVTGSGRGRPKSDAFVAHVRCLLATGLFSRLSPVISPLSFPLSSHLSYPVIGYSARSAREQTLVSASFYMNPKHFEEFREEVPHLSWFKTQRKGLGYEAWLYAMVRLAGCDCCLQWGFDETSLDGVPTLNQWVLLAEPGAPPSVVTIECARILVGSTASEIAAHISQSWDNGQTAVAILRVKLGAAANMHVPVRNGGVMLHKLQGNFKRKLKP